MLSYHDGIELLRQFPEVECAFAYGSGVVKQDGYDYTSKSKASLNDLPMVDLVFIVDDTYDWHKQNRNINPSHYSTPFPMTTSMITYLQNETGAGIYYNAMVEMNIKSYPNRLMKYGVMSRQQFLDDMLNWKFLYVSGRLHKPVQMLKTSPLIDFAVQRNRDSAMLTALLLLPNSFSEIDLYIKIAGLSYFGDPRMSIGENPQKVINLVLPVMASYRQLYQKSIDSFGPSMNLKTLLSGDKILYTKNISNECRWKLCEALPNRLKVSLMIKSRSKYLKHLPPKSTALAAALSTIVARSATSQSFKGLLSAGFIKCSVYIFAKITKRFSKQTVARSTPFVTVT